MEKTARNKGAGILCHISSLPGKYGIGTLGREAYRFVDSLVKCGAKYWQILPLQQTGYGDSPYQSVCCLSGNPYFIDPEDLRAQGLIDADELKGAERAAGDVDFAELYESRYALFRKAYARFNIKNADFLKFVDGGEFDDYALFMSLKSRYGGTFTSFPDAYKYREHLAISEFRNAVYRTEYCFWLFLQYEFRRQWSRLKEYANDRGIKIIGDIPLYVASDSSDSWARPELFQLDEGLKPTKVAGVPPDYFSRKGQLWGNPLYNWNVMRAENYDWWINRIKKASEMYDVVRIDHFRGLDRYYAIPAGALNAVTGEWEKGPGMELFDAIKSRLGDVDLIAEDLGILDDGVLKLREDSGLPGMKILMFAFDGNEQNEYLPANICENSVTYTGTHDNDTALGFLYKMTDAQFREFKAQLRKVLRGQKLYLPVVTREDAVQALVLSALNTPSYLTVIPIQDVLGLDNRARMNTPSIACDNWRFRLKKAPDRRSMAILKKMIASGGRA